MRVQSNKEEMNPSATEKTNASTNTFCENPKRGTYSFLNGNIHV
jgi:hypothetical protein